MFHFQWLCLKDFQGELKEAYRPIHPHPQPTFLYLLHLMSLLEPMFSYNLLLDIAILICCLHTVLLVVSTLLCIVHLKVVTKPRSSSIRIAHFWLFKTLFHLIFFWRSIYLFCSFVGFLMSGRPDTSQRLVFSKSHYQVRFPSAIAFFIKRFLPAPFYTRISDILGPLLFF